MLQEAYSLCLKHLFPSVDAVLIDNTNVNINIYDNISSNSSVDSMDSVDFMDSDISDISDISDSPDSPIIVPVIDSGKGKRKKNRRRRRIGIVSEHEANSSPGNVLTRLFQQLGALHNDSFEFIFFIREDSRTGKPGPSLGQVSLSPRYKGLFLYTVGFLFHVEWCIRQI